MLSNQSPEERLRAALSDRYQIERELGEGGMATVYLARDLKHHRKVALKVLRPELAATVGPDRFLQEVRVTANLQHPHILPLFDSGEADGFLYYVMPYLEGESLRERLAREGELPVAEAVRILREVTDALAAAHEVGVVHRDIKPDNIMLSGRHAVVADFGVAKAVSEATGRHQLTTKGVALGTPAYMAPEQAAANEHIDHRADIYAVGAMGYELLSGRPPFTGMTAQQVLAAHVTEAPRPVTELRDTVPAGLGEVLMRCLAKKPADRWQSAEELLQQLELYATPGTGTTPTQMQPTKATGGTGGIPRWMKVAVPVALVSLLVTVWFGGREPVEPTTDTAAPEGAASGLRANGFVVVPFVNQTGVDSLATLGSVLADYLTGQVSRNRIGWVAPASTVRELKAERPEGTEAVPYYAGETGARYVVSGSYFRQGDALMVQAEVSDAETRELVASVGPVAGSLTDFMDAATAAAEQVLVVLARILDPAAAPPSVGGTPRSYAAYQDYAQGQDLWAQGDRARALEFFYRALEKDSTYAEALLMASTTEWNLGRIPRADTVAQIAERYRDQMSPWDVVMLDWLQGFFAGDREEIYRVGRQWAELDPVRGGDYRGARMAGHLREAVEDCMKWYDRSYDKTGLVGFFWTDLLTSLHLLGEHETELEHARTAREYNPSAQGAFFLEGVALAALGQVDEVRSLMTEAKTHGDAFNQGWLLRQVAMDLRFHGYPDAARELLEESLKWYEDSERRNSGLAETLFDLDRYEEAREVAEAAVAESPSAQGYGILGSSAAALGDRETAVAMEETLQEMEAVPYVFGTPALWRALIRAQLGDLDTAVEFLEEAYAAGNSVGLWLHYQPQLDALRGYPAYDRFIAPR